MSMSAPTAQQGRLREAAHHETVMDVGTERIAHVYAEAWLSTAESHGQADALLDELNSLTTDVFRTDPLFEAFLSSSAIDRHTKANALRNAFGTRASALFLNGLLVLNDHERLGLLRAIAGAYRELRDQRAGRVHVEVRSAIPLPDDQRDRLLQRLRETLHKEPVLEASVEPELLGGLVVQVGDWLYDHSVRTQLETIRNQLIARSSYEIQSGRDRFSTESGN
jgi:F-type H+-transporting ATPase subunit delta